MENLCTICFKPMVDSVTAPCRHKFCRRCINSHLQTNQECPIFCDGTLTKAQLKPIHTSQERSFVVERTHLNPLLSQSMYQSYQPYQPQQPYVKPVKQYSPIRQYGQIQKFPQQQVVLNQNFQRFSMPMQLPMSQNSLENSQHLSQIKLQMESVNHSLKSLTSPTITQTQLKDKVSLLNNVHQNIQKISQLVDLEQSYLVQKDQILQNDVDSYQNRSKYLPKELHHSPVNLNTTTNSFYQKYNLNQAPQYNIMSARKQVPKNKFQNTVGNLQKYINVKKAINQKRVKNSFTQPKFPVKQVQIVEEEKQRELLFDTEVRYLNYFGVATKMPNSSDQKIQIKSVIKNEENQEELPGDSRFVISMSWWNKWCDFVQYDITATSNRKHVSKESPPDQISNKELITKDMQIREECEENIDFISFGLQSYQLLKQWYGIDYEIEVPLCEYEGDTILKLEVNEEAKKKGVCAIF